MMGTRARFKGGGEWDALSKRSKRLHRWRAGLRAAFKAKFWRRVRREPAPCLREELGLGIASDTPPPGAKMTFWCIFERPADFPKKMVLRPQYLVEGSDHPVVSQEVWLRDSIEELRELIPPGLYRQPRLEGDPPALVEVWY